MKHQSFVGAAVGCSECRCYLKRRSSQVMRKHWPSIALVTGLAAVIVVFGACSLTGPTCTDYLGMTDTQQRKAALDWLVFNDLVEDRTSMQVDRQVTGTQQFLVVQCKIQQQQDIPTMLNQFRP